MIKPAYDIVITVRRSENYIGVACKNAATHKRVCEILTPLARIIFPNTYKNEIAFFANPCYTLESIVGELCTTFPVSKTLQNGL